MIRRFIVALVLSLMGAVAYGQVIVTPVAGVATIDVGTCGQGGASPNPSCSFKLTLTANTTIAFNNVFGGASVSLFINPSTFTVTWPSSVTPTPTLTASQNNLVSLRYDGASNTWNGIGGGSSTAAASLPGGSQIYVATSCPAATTNCFAVNKDTTWVIDATFNSTSTVTTTAGDVAFACPGSIYPCSVAGAGSDVGKVAFGNTNCSFATAVGCSTYACPQTTILTVNSAHSVTLALACTANSSGSLSVFVWGHDDGAQLVAATNAMLATQTAKSGVPINLSLPCGAMMTSVNPFIGNQASIPASFSITGCGSGTIIVPLPKMSCTGGAGHGCLIDFPIATYGTNGFTPAGVIRDITFYGGGQTLHDASATITAQTSGIFTNFQYGLDNVWVIGWISGELVRGITNIGSVMHNSGTFAGGGIGCQFQGSAGTKAVMYGGTCGGGGGNNMQVVQTSGSNDETDFFGVYYQNGGGSSGMVVSSGIFKDFGGQIFNSLTVSGGIAYLDGTVINSGGLFGSGGEVHLHNTRFVATANLQQTAGNVFDDCGNNLPFSSFTTFTAGNPHGTCSITGIADVAGNHVLSAGFGTTATVTAVGGDTLSVAFTVNSTGTGQAASPTITDTFALGNGGFWKSPNTGCTLQQIGGTFGVLTNPVPSALSRTGVTWTFSGTPVAGQSYTFIRTCS